MSLEVIKNGNPFGAHRVIKPKGVLPQPAQQIDNDFSRIQLKSKAVLFENSLYAKLPEDMPETKALDVLDVCVAPAQAARLVKQGDTAAINCAGGKSGILCAWEATTE